MDILKIPFVTKVGLKKNNDGNLELSNKPDVQNHLQSIHAGAQFTLAETASGELLQIMFPEFAENVIPVLRDAQIKYKRLHRKPLQHILLSRKKNQSNLKINFFKKVEH